MRAAQWALVALTVVLCLVLLRQSRRMTAWEAQADSALTISSQLRVAHIILARQAAADSARADLEKRAADQLGRQADSLHRALVAALARPVGPAPADTAPATERAVYWQRTAGQYLEQRDLALRELTELRPQRDSLAAAFESQRRATAALALAYRGEQARADSLARVLGRAPRMPRAVTWGLGADALTVLGPSPCASAVVGLRVGARTRGRVQLEGQATGGWGAGGCAGEPWGSGPAAQLGGAVTF